MRISSLKPIVIVAACVLGAQASLAADGPAWPNLPAARPAPPDWAGFYVGGNLGAALGHASASDSWGPYRLTATQDLTGVEAGVQAGYNWQANNLVFGIEGDAQVTSQQRDALLCSNCFGARWNLQDSMPWYATLRGRFGFVGDHFMLYGTAGAALMQVSSKLQRSNLGVTTDWASWSRTRAGWTIGGGIEYAMSAAWITRVEYLYLDTGSFDTQVDVPALGTFEPRLRVQQHIVRVGASYRF